MICDRLFLYTREEFIVNIIEKIIGTYSQRELKRITPIVEEVMAQEDKNTA